MDNSQTKSANPWLFIVSFLAIVVVVFLAWQYSSSDEKNTTNIPPVAVQPVVIEEPEPQVVESEPVIEKVVETPVVEQEVVLEPEPALPTLEESDTWLKERLPSITWRKELLKLVIDDDMIRRFVVFTDNFSQGVIAYEHSLLVQPSTSFSAREINDDGKVTLKWDETTSRRFSLYVDLLRSLDSDTLISWYYELKPLIDQSYEELGYPDEDFTDILQDAITKVLDMEIPKERLELTRPSVMYQYKNEDIEKLDDVDKLLLRLGKENLLVIKSVLLEINEKLARARP